MAGIVIVGAGIIGAALAYRLSAAGAQVTVVEAGPVAGAASGASFGWINASFFADTDHFRLRAEGIAAWHALQDEAGGLPLSWQGALWWEEQGAAFEAFRKSLAGLGYKAEPLTRAQFAELAPAIAAPPDQALLLGQEGAAETAQVAAVLLARAADLGAVIYTGVRVLAVDEVGGRVTGVQTAQGPLAADHVVLAAGTATADLLTPLGQSVPMLPRPGVTLTTAPVAPCLRHVMVSPGLEFRQLPDGRILAPTSAKHQQDETAQITEPLSALSARTLERLRALLPGQDLRARTVTLAMRPVPGDGLPVIGAAGPEGLYLAVMHSGVTLAAAVARFAAQEILGRGAQNLLGPYRPQRFADHPAAAQA